MGWYSRSQYSDYPPYIPVAQRKQEAIRLVEKLKKKGQVIQPIQIEGRMIVKTFWGKQWCKNLEQYSDYESRLPRGRSYVRHGSVINLEIKAGEVTALVKGSSLYEVSITIDKVKSSEWQMLMKECAGQIDSLIELLQGKFSKGVMAILTQPEKGLFPRPKEIHLKCNCPDYAEMCKHVAAVLYGIGARLDEEPEALFLLRQANHLDLLETAVEDGLEPTLSQSPTKTLDADLSSLFDIDLAGVEQKTTSNSFQSQKKKVKKQETNIKK